MSRYLNRKCTVLKDDRILEDLEKAKEMYEDGELLETARVLEEIAYAIKNWKPDYE